MKKLVNVETVNLRDSAVTADRTLFASLFLGQEGEVLDEASPEGWVQVKAKLPYGRTALGFCVTELNNSKVSWDSRAETSRLR